MSSKVEEGHNSQLFHFNLQCKKKIFPVVATTDKIRNVKESSKVDPEMEKRKSGKLD